MAIGFVEFLIREYEIRKMFVYESAYQKEMIEF